MDQGTSYSTFESSTRANRSHARSQNWSVILCKRGEARDWCVYLGTLITNILLTLTIAITIVVLTAIGKKNINIPTYDEGACDCTPFTLSIGYGLGGSLFVELGLIAATFVFIMVGTLVEDMCRSEWNIFENCYVVADGALIGLNFAAFLGMTVAVVGYIANGGDCCSETSIAVASLSVFLVLFKIVCFTIICCYTCCCDSRY